jgi:hypothetical protein
MLLKPFAIALLMTIFSCNGTQSQQNSQVAAAVTSPSTEVFSNVREIPPPGTYARKQAAVGSFVEWLRNLSLKPDRTVYLFNGSPKANQAAQFAVLDISVGEKDLQQCADAAMRLRAEYLFAQKAYDQIKFIDNEQTIYQFEKPYTNNNLHHFLQRVFGMCGTASLSKQMKTVNAQNLQPGDLLLKGGFPGHAVIILDVAANLEGEKIYLLAQSYMPAQDIHVLINPVDETISPWYKLDGKEMIETPEWTFNSRQFKSW